MTITNKNNLQIDVIIIGAGAAGLMCAIEAGKRGRKVLVIERAEKIGKKICFIVVTVFYYSLRFLDFIISYNF